jgi:hypothetical protein
MKEVGAIIRANNLKSDDDMARLPSSLLVLPLLLLQAVVLPTARADVSSVDVFTHGEHPLCTCLRIPSVVATSSHLFAFAECRSWRGDGCDPMAPSSDARSAANVSAGEQGGGTHIAVKSSADGGEHWSAITILTEGCQPTAVYDVSRDALLFMFKNNSRQDARLMLNRGGNWSAPRLVIDPAKQERDKRPLFPGPGNAIMLSADHPTNPGRLLFPVWLGPDGSTTSASLFYSDDGGETFKQTRTAWPHDGNDESTVSELANGTVLYVTRSNTSPCVGQADTSRCLEMARSTDGGTSFVAVGKGTVNDQLAGAPAAVSMLAVVDHTSDEAHNYFKTNWKSCTQSTGGWASTISKREGSTFVIVSATTAATVPTGRQSWHNISIAATLRSKVYLEGPGNAACHGNADYSSMRCNAKTAKGVYTSTCFDLLPISFNTGATMHYGSAVVLRAPVSMDGGKYLNPTTGAFDLDSSTAAGWTLVSAVAPNSSDIFVGGPFALRPGVHPPPYTPPPPPRSPTPPNRTLYLSHPENLAMTGRTNGTVRASTDGGRNWDWTFQVTLDRHPHAPSVFARQAFGYSCLTAMPSVATSPFNPDQYIGLLWESSTNDCTGTDASCAVKFSVVPMITTLISYGHGAATASPWSHLKSDDDNDHHHHDYHHHDFDMAVLELVPGQRQLFVDELHIRSKRGIVTNFHRAQKKGAVIR